MLGPGVKTGLNIMMDNPGQLGADQVADAVAGLANYPVPLDRDRYGNCNYSIRCQQQKTVYRWNDPPGRRSFSGCAHCQSLPAQRNQHGCSETCYRQKYHRMHEKRCSLQQCSSPGRNYRHGSKKNWAKKQLSVATGGLAKKIIPHCKRKIILDEELLLRGLLIIYEKNK